MVEEYSRDFSSFNLKKIIHPPDPFLFFIGDQEEINLDDRKVFLRRYDVNCPAFSDAEVIALSRDGYKTDLFSIVVSLANGEKLLFKVDNKKNTGQIYSLGRSVEELFVFKVFC